METSTFDWSCNHTWKQSAKNTAWCLLGCAIGDFGTIYYFQEYTNITDVMFIMPIAMFNGIITSIILETIILLKQMSFKKALTTALMVFSTAFGTAFFGVLIDSGFSI